VTAELLGNDGFEIADDSGWFPGTNNLAIELPNTLGPVVPGSVGPSGTVLDEAAAHEVTKDRAAEKCQGIEAVGVLVAILIRHEKARIAVIHVPFGVAARDPSGGLSKFGNALRVGLREDELNLVVVADVVTIEEREGPGDNDLVTLNGDGQVRVGRA